MSKKQIARKKIIVTCPYKNAILDKGHIWSIDCDDMSDFFELLKPIHTIICKHCYLVGIAEL